MKKIASLLLISWLLISHIIYVSANTPAAISSTVWDIKLANPDERWFIWNIFASIFDVSGRIRNNFIIAFQSIEWNFVNTLPRWDGMKFVHWVIRDDGSNIGIWILPNNAYRVNIDGDINFTGNIFQNGELFTSQNIHGTWSELDDSRFIKYDDNNYVWIWRTNAEARLDVWGKIIMRVPTGNDDEPNIVATKWYVDSRTNCTAIRTRMWLSPDEFNCDVTAVFSLDILRIAVWLTPTKPEMLGDMIYDINWDNTINSVDALEALRFVVWLESQHFTRAYNAASKYYGWLWKVATVEYVNSLIWNTPVTLSEVSQWVSIEDVMNTLLDCNNQYSLCFDRDVNITATFALDILRTAVGLESVINWSNPVDRQIFTFWQWWNITASHALDALRYVSWLTPSANPAMIEAAGKEWISRTKGKNINNYFVNKDGDTLKWSYSIAWNLAIADISSFSANNQNSKLFVDWDARISWTISASTPTEDNHVATKSYVDNKVATPPICSWNNQALGWNGNNWICNTITISNSWGINLDLVNSLHSSTQCTNLWGTVLTDAYNNKFCRFNSASCPVWWTQYQNWRTTSPNTCRSTGSTPLWWQESCPPCTTGSDTWSNQATKPSCTYANVRYHEGSWGDISIRCYLGWTSTCTANVSQIWCY